MDILPTLARLSGTSVKANKKIDGVDIWPVLAGTASTNPPRQDFFYYRGLALEAVRLGKWKLHLAGNGDQPGKKAASSAMLFNLDDDIGEAQNVVADHPDIVQKLQAMVDGMDKDLGTRGIGPGCRPLGRSSAPKPLIDDDGNVREGFVGSARRFP